VGGHQHSQKQEHDISLQNISKGKTLAIVSENSDSNSDSTVKTAATNSS
jgi:hypothetical protein